MQKSTRFLFFLAFIFSYPSFSQVDSVELSNQYYQMGMDIFNFEHRRQAKDMFVLAAQMNPKNASAHLMAGKSIMLTVHKDEALPYFMDAWILEPEIDEEIIYLVGQAYQYSQKFDSAIMFYELYNIRLARSMKFKKSLKMNEVNHRIFECRNAKIFKYYPVDVEITNLGTTINSEWPEYAPTISADESVLVFTSRRPDGTNPNLAEDLQYYEDIYISYQKDGKWEEAKNIGQPVNTMYHSASINLAPDGKSMFKYSDNNGGDIYETILLENGKWSRPKALKGEVNTSYIENSAAISADGQKLYFSSNKPGGYGKMDIYVATLSKSGAWIDAENLGPDINTELDEEGVFISASGRYLFFSSNGHAGMGDLDIYRSEIDSATNKWKEPLNLGYPLNSVENDVFYTLTGDDRYAYYSSIQSKSHGEQDIYKVDMINWKPVDLTQPVFVKEWVEKEEKKIIAVEPDAVPVSADIYLEYTVVDEISLGPIDAKVVFISSDDRLISPEKISIGKYGYRLKNDKYSKYDIRITKDGYLPHLSEILILGTDPQTSEIKETIILKKALVNFSAVLNVYFGLDSDEPNSFEDIQYIGLLMNETPSLKVEISGYTDNSGSPEYNKDLSQRRAESVRKHLINVGIDPSRITSRGYGEENPVASNELRSGRRLNRRTEFKIIED